MEKKKVETFGHKLGSFCANVCMVCLSTCFVAVLFALTVKFVTWLFGGII